MVDNRSAGFFGIGGAFNFKSGDISGTAAKTQDDKMGQGTEYGVLEGDQKEEQPNTPPFIDRSAQLRATLNSLALMNVANVLNDKKRNEILNEEARSKFEQKDEEKEKNKNEGNKELDEEFLNDFDDDNSEDEEDNEYY